MHSKNIVMSHLFRAKVLGSECIDRVESKAPLTVLIPLLRDADHEIHRANILLMKRHMKVCIKNQCKSMKASDLIDQMMVAYKYSHSM